MKTKPIYIKTLTLNNIRTFGENAFLNFEKEDKKIPNWTLILGENSIGKSTLLQCIAWMKPFLPYDAVGTKGFVPAPIINDEENEVLIAIVKKNQHIADLKANFIAGKELSKIRSPDSKVVCNTSMEIFLEHGKLIDVKHNVITKKEHKELFYTQEILLFAYSASRKLGKLNLNDKKLIDTIPNFINEKTELYDAEEILHTLNYAELGAKNKTQKNKYEKFIESIKNMLVKILPDFDKIEDIQISPPNILNGDYDGGVTINTRHGKAIPFNDFSLGYKTITSLSIDLAWRMFNKYQDLNTDPLLEPAIVLIDEIDLHLHPLWQREIMNNISSHFPNVQFIATAHSPLMVQSGLDANYAVLNYSNGSVQIENNPQSIDGWRVDQILTSEFFGLKSSRGIEYENLLSVRDKLLKKKHLLPSERKKLKSTTLKITQLPTGETPDEIENRRLISELVSKIKKNKIKIKL